MPPAASSPASASRRLHRAGLCLVLALLGAWLSWLPFGLDVEERLGLPVLFALRGARQPPGDVMIVGMDGRSSAKAGWPSRPELWPRSRHAELIGGLARSCARLIVYDVFFAAERDAQQDGALADALREAGNVILVSHLGIGDEVPASIPANGWQVERKPMARFGEAALAVAPFPLPAAGEVSGFWLFKPDAGDVPALPGVAALAQAEGGRSVKPAGGSYTEWLRQARQSAREGVPVAAGSTEPGLLNRLSRMPDFVYLNWFGPARTVPTLEFPLALQRAAETAGCHEPFAGKTVFVGMSETSPVEQKDRDVFDTPFTTEAGSRLSGVELAATAFANLRDGDAIRRADEVLQLASLLAWGVVAGVLWTSLPASTATWLSLAAALGHGALAHWLFAARNLWLPWVIPAVQLLAAAGGGLLLQRRWLQLRLDGLKQALSHWLPDDVVAEIVADPEISRRATGLVHGTCMAVRAVGVFQDRHGADPLAQGTQLMEMLRSVDQTLSRHCGVAAEQTRYGRLAIWVSAAPDATLRRAACLAGVALRSGLPKSPNLSLRIGLHCGRIAVAGGGDLRRSFGTIVDIAEHIEALNETLGTSLLASSETLQGMGGWLIRPLGRFQFPDSPEPVEVSEVRDFQSGERKTEDELLYRNFAAALDAYRRGDFDDCGEQLLEILQRYPEDGPSHYYLRRCEYFRQNPQIAGWDSVIRL